MKKITTLILLMALVITASSQTVNIETNRRVATKGYAEKEITPDIVYLSINIKEFYLDGNMKKKVSIETLEKQFYEAALSVGVKKEDITIQNIFSYNQENKKKNNELLQSRQFRIKLSNLKGLNTMMDKINPQGLQSTSIESYDISNRKDIEKELKIAAVKDARANAEILAQADGQTLGAVLIINDNSTFNSNDLLPQTRFMYAKSVNAESVSSDANSLNIEVRPIKITSYIDCVFALK